MKRQTVYISALAAILLAAGCQKNGLENQNLNDGTVRYAVVMDDYTQTKGMLVNTDGSDKALSEFATAIGNKFAARAFEGSGSTPIITQDVEWKTDKWVGTPVAYWPQATSLTFLASANLPESEDVAKVSYASTGVTLDYKAVPEAASAQKDILLGHYKGNGGNTGTAQIHFEHPMTAVRFLRGDIDAGLVIKSISISGVASSGTATMDVSGAITWSGVSGYTHTVSQTKADGLGEDGTTKLIGEPFIIIPQNLSINGVKVNVSFTDGTEVEATISSGEWQMGKTNTYTLNIDGSIVSISPEEYNGCPLGVEMVDLA